MIHVSAKFQQIVISSFHALTTTVSPSFTVFKKKKKTIPILDIHAHTHILMYVVKSFRESKTFNC